MTETTLRFLLSWAPFVVIIGLWIWFSVFGPQRRLRALCEEQTKLLRRQTELLECIAKQTEK